MCEKIVLRLEMHANAVRILSKGYLPISLWPAMKLKEILYKVNKAIQSSNLDYDIVIKRLALYYDMKLATLGINEDRNLIVQLPIFYSYIYNNLCYIKSKWYQ